jgi:mannose-6-phosphate isomerase class I
MAGSDNVVRGCFTPKKIDKELLCKVNFGHLFEFQIISTKMSEKEIIEGDTLASVNKEGYSMVKYPTPYNEFTCYKIVMPKSGIETSDFHFTTPCIVLSIQGEGKVSIKSSKEKDGITKDMKEGQSLFLVPHSYFTFKASDKGLHVYICTSQCLSVD